MGSFINGFFLEKTFIVSRLLFTLSFAHFAHAQVWCSNPTLLGLAGMFCELFFILPVM